MNSEVKLSRLFFFVALPAIAVLLLVIYSGMELYRHFTTSDRYVVKSVEVISEGPANKQELISLASVRPNTNIFSLDLSLIRTKVEKNPWVAQATISRSLPNKILIEYKAHEPMAILNAGSMYYVNKDGRPFYKIARGDSLQYPLMNLESHSGPWNEQLFQRLRDAIALNRSLENRNSSLKAQVGDITVHGNMYRGGAPFNVTIAYILPVTGKSTHYSLSVGEENLPEQIQRLDVVEQQLLWQKKWPKLVRLELGKKVVVKIAQ
jgi:hypothetical protein